MLNLYPTHHFRVREEMRRPAEPELGTTDLDTSIATPAIIDGFVTLSVDGVFTLVNDASVDEKASLCEPKLPTSPSMIEVRSISKNSFVLEKQCDGPSLGNIYVGQEHLARGIKVGVFAGRRRCVLLSVQSVVPYLKKCGAFVFVSIPGSTCEFGMCCVLFRYLIRSTVTENITLGRRGVTEADVLRACQDVRLAKRIQLKYKTGFKQVIDPQDRGPNGLSDLECCQVSTISCAHLHHSYCLMVCPWFLQK